MNPSESDSAPHPPRYKVKDPQAVMDSAKAAREAAVNQPPPFIAKDPQAVMESANASHAPPTKSKDPQAIIDSANAATVHPPPFIVKDPQAVMDIANPPRPPPQKQKDPQAIIDSANAAAAHPPPFIVKDPQAVMDSAAAARAGSTSSNPLSGMSFKYQYPSDTRPFHISFRDAEVFFTVPPEMENGKRWISRPCRLRELRDRLYLAHWLTEDDKGPGHMTLVLDLQAGTVSMAGLVGGREMFDTAKFEHVYEGGLGAVWDIPVGA